MIPSDSLDATAPAGRITLHGTGTGADSLGSASSMRGAATMPAMGSSLPGAATVASAGASVASAAQLGAATAGPGEVPAILAAFERRLAALEAIGDGMAASAGATGALAPLETRVAALEGVANTFAESHPLVMQAVSAVRRMFPGEVKTS